jgi:hypothetical protein
MGKRGDREKKWGTGGSVRKVGDDDEALGDPQEDEMRNSGQKGTRV